MQKDISPFIIQTTQADSIKSSVIVQELWSGYGTIQRVSLNGSSHSSVIVKQVQPPNQTNHPRGWNSNLSHQRKCKSYTVERYWYQNYSNQCTQNSYVPRCLASEMIDNNVVLILEDLNDSGFDIRKQSVTIQDMQACLKWLAYFHATFMHQSPDGLWTVGTYWHLDTRPDELNGLKDQTLKQAASIIDQKLNESPFQTFVHGDAKLANFCFSMTNNYVAAVDFQYVGGGCGMKDVAYFIGSCLHEEECEEYEDVLLDYYFNELKEALVTLNESIEFEALEQNWRYLFPMAWTDFHRFIKGWSPGHWKINSYSERMAQKTLELL